MQLHGKAVAIGLGLSILAACVSSESSDVAAPGLGADTERETLSGLFDNADDPNITIAVNRYLWTASLQVLNFMPVEAADPFTGIIQFGYGTPPGANQAFRATVLIQDPALEARSLRVAVESQSGPVTREAARQIENAILTRARQIRVQDASL